MADDRKASSFTGRTRERKTSAGVRWGDRIARLFITVGGIGTIIAVLGVCVFLVWVAAPLFSSARVEGETTLGAPREGRVPIAAKIDEEVVLGWSLYDDGSLDVVRLDSGETILRKEAPEGAAVTSIMSDPVRDEIALGLADGSVRTGAIRIVTEYPLDSEVPDEHAKLGRGELATLDGGVLTITPDGQFRLDRVEYLLDAPFSSGNGDPVVAIDYVEEGGVGSTACTLDAAGRLRLHIVEKTENLMTGDVTVESSSYDLPMPASETRPEYLLVTSLGDQVFLGWSSGRVVRLAVRSPESAEIVEEFDVSRGEDPVTAMRFLIGRTSLLVGHEHGDVDVWFGTKPEDAATPDGVVMANARRLRGVDSPVRSIGLSSRSRMALVGHEDGSVRLHQVTAGDLLLETRLEGAPPRALTVSPREDAIFAASTSNSVLWRVDPRYPAATPATLFGKVQYEGYGEPIHKWQSSAGTDDSEPKFGFAPLVFGTLKATFYSLLFGVPIALLAAIYSSEYLGARARRRIKPAIEMMASLPSVVLGFLAALVFAPVVERVVPAVLLAFVAVPFCFALGAFLWQLLPRRRALLLERLRVWFMALCLPVGIAASFLFAPLVERLLFAGDIKAWLDGQVGGATGGWLILTFPLCALFVSVLGGRVAHPFVTRLGTDWSRGRVAAFELARFLAFTAVIGAAALGLAWLLSVTGLDPRGSFVDTYVQRNALVVGFVMGFAIIPIIYTIAEDALTSVPDHLRAASLGAGATAWQTATRVIVPTAASGLFSAVMIGLGRAVGETMIVLMAAGNTAVMDLNVFNGFRTLAANIATELPETAKYGTHYRTLYLAALVLFTMTFVINALAEFVRQRFRKRAFQL